MKVGPAQIVDFTDPTYGGRVRHLRKDDGHEHNLYYCRDVWNADGSQMLGIQSDLQQQNWHICLCDGDGVFLKELFPISQYDWRLCWDRNDSDLLYTWKGSDLYRFHVAAGKAGLLKSFAPLGLKPNGPSCNQAGDRLDGSDDRVLFTVPRSQAHFSNLHLSWPRKVNDWFVAGFFPSAASQPGQNAYEPPFDEILLIRLDGTTRYLARTGTVYSAPAGRGRSGDMFWAQTLPRPSADGKRICFNSNRSGTIDLCLLLLDAAGN